MTRRRIIAGVILLAAVAVVVPLVPGVWERVAYRDEVAGGFRIKVRRFEWMSRSRYFADQMCGSCQDREKHQECWERVLRKTPSGALRVPVNLGRGEWEIVWILVTDDFRCTCTDPSHDGESK